MPSEAPILSVFDATGGLIASTDEMFYTLAKDDNGPAKWANTV